MFIRGVCRSARSGVILPPSGPSENLPVCLQQRLGYQDEEERSLNSLDDSPAFPLLSSSSSRSRPRGNSLDRDRQLLEDLLSFYLTAPSSSSSSSSSVSRHAGGGGTAAAGFPPSSSSSSSSSFFSDLDFPLDYGENYVSQVAQLKKQQQQQEEEKKKQQEEYDALSGLDGEWTDGQTDS